jgi:crotonobetainyl-CoA:carnitine CoA-transferase CaiB-like acyl-CoA transferase
VQHDKREAMQKLIAIGVPAGAVFDTMELQNEPDFEQRGFMQQVHHHNGDDKMATWPVRIDGKTVRLKGAPALGQHNDEVLQQWLGLGAGELGALRSEGVI